MLAMRAAPRPFEMRVYEIHQVRWFFPSPCNGRSPAAASSNVTHFRIGGGYRHSYWFVQKMIERAKDQELRRLALLRREERKIFQEKLMWRVGANGKRACNLT